MSNGFLQDESIDYPIYALIQSSAGTTATINTGTEDFLFDPPELHLDWASPDAVVGISGLEMQTYAGGFTVYALTETTISFNIRLGTGQLLDISEGTVEGLGEGDAVVVVSMTPMTARVGTAIVALITEVEVSGFGMVAYTNTVKVYGVPFTEVELTGLQMNIHVGAAQCILWGEPPDLFPDKWTNMRNEPPPEIWTSRRTTSVDNWIRKEGHA